MKMKYITVDPNKKGARFGHQFLQLVIGWIISKQINNCEYIHKGFSSNCKNWEEFLQLNNHFNKDVKVENYKKIKWLKGIEKNKIEKNANKLKKEIDKTKENTLIELINPFPGLNFKDVNLIKDEFRNIYYKEERSHILDKDYYNITIHIRRGDVSPNSKKHGQIIRFLPLSYYKELIKNIHQNIPFKNYKINIISEGSPRDFSELENINLILSECEFKSFHTMVESDLLITGLSTYSIIAAILNKNKIITPKFSFYTSWVKNDRVIKDPNDIIRILNNDFK